MPTKEQVLKRMEEWEMSDHPLIEALKKLETGLGDEAANHIATLEKRVKQLGRTKAAEQIESLQREKAEIEAELKRAYADLESIRRENEKLKADKEQWVRRAQTRQDALNAARKEISESERLSQGVVPERLIEGAQAAAITPEMRERMKGAIYNPKHAGVWTTEQLVRELGVMNDILRDLLGEQG